MDKIKTLIRAGAYQHDFFKHFAVIHNEWEKLSESGKAELTRVFPNVSQYLDSKFYFLIYMMFLGPEFKRRASLGADYD